MMMPKLIIAAVLMVTAVQHASAQAPNAQSQPPFGERWQEVPAKPPVPQARNLAVGVEQAFYLVRSTLLTLNDANRSGNYSVLRDLAAPDFQAKNSPADLTESFSDLRRRKFDLFAAALAAPQLNTAPALDGRGMLRLTGYFPTRPLQIDFDLLFQNVGGQWRLFGISVATPVAAAAPPQPPAPRKAPAPTH
jgi:hypothetical protein